MRLWVAVAVLCMVVGCGRSGDEPADDANGNGSAKAIDGGSSPEDVFSIMQSGFEEGDFKAVFYCVAPEDHDKMLFAAEMILGLSTASNPEAKAELEDVLKKHGVNMEKKTIKLGDENSMDEVLAEAFKDVKDKAALFHELMSTGTKLGIKNFSFVLKDAQLKDLKIDGDTATATIVSDKGEKPAHFIKQNGRWYTQMK